MAVDDQISRTILCSENMWYLLSVRDMVLNNPQCSSVPSLSANASLNNRRVVDAPQTSCEAGLYVRIIRAGCLIPVVGISVVLLLPHQFCVIVRHRAVAVVRKTHRVDVVCPVLPRACAGYFIIGTIILYNTSSVRCLED